MTLPPSHVTTKQESAQASPSYKLARSPSVRTPGSAAALLHAAILPTAAAAGHLTLGLRPWSYHGGRCFCLGQEAKGSQ